jgi:predicted NUDIX family phosphoesterase
MPRLVAVGRQVARVRVEAGQHAVQRRLDQLLVVDLGDVLVLDRAQHVAEQLQHLVGLGLGGVVRLGDGADIGHGPRAEDKGRNSDEQILAH